MLFIEGVVPCAGSRHRGEWYEWRLRKVYSGVYCYNSESWTPKNIMAQQLMPAIWRIHHNPIKKSSRQNPDGADD